MYIQSYNLRIPILNVVFPVFRSVSFFINYFQHIFDAMVIWKPSERRWLIV